MDDDTREIMKLCDDLAEVITMKKIMDVPTCVSKINKIRSLHSGFVKRMHEIEMKFANTIKKDVKKKKDDDDDDRLECHPLHLLTEEEESV